MANSRKTESAAKHVHFADIDQPRDVHAEQALVGALIAHRGTHTFEALQIATPDDCFDPATAAIYRALEAIADAGKEASFDRVRSQLLGMGLWEVAGGREHIGQCIDSVVSGSDWRYHAELVHGQALRRSVLSAAASAVQNALDPTQPIAAILDQFDRDVSALNDNAIGSPPATGADLARIALETLDRSATERRGITTGYTDVNRMLGAGGLQPGSLVILAGRPSMGKTALALNLAQHALESAGGVLFVSLEMSRDELSLRFLAAVSETSYSEIRDGNVSDRSRAVIDQAAQQIADWTFCVVDDPRVGTRGIAAHARRLQRRKKVDLVIVDYLQLIEPVDARVPRQEQVAATTRSLRAMAKELDVPVICLAQLNRQVEQLRRNQSGSNGEKSGRGRPQVGVKSGAGRAGEIDANADEPTTTATATLERVGKAHSGKQSAATS